MKCLMLLLISVTLFSCKYDGLYLQIPQLENKKDTVLSIYNNELNNENQLIIKNYFSSIKTLTYTISSDSKIQKYFHKKFNKYFNAKTCNNSLINNNVFQIILQKCYVNNFYICAEEVKFYKNILISLRKILSKEELALITKDEPCNNKLLSLGVIGE